MLLDTLSAAVGRLFNAKPGFDPELAEREASGTARVALRKLKGSPDRSRSASHRTFSFGFAFFIDGYCGDVNGHRCDKGKVMAIAERCATELLGELWDHFARGGEVDDESFTRAFARHATAGLRGYLSI